MEASAATNPTTPATPPSDNIVRVEDLVMHFPITQGILFQRQVGAVRAVDGVSFAIKRGETLGLVGESGSGKSTIGRCLVRLYQPTSGHMYLGGDDLVTAKGAELRAIRRRVQMIFQDPYASLDPRMSVGALIGEPMVIYKTGTRSEIRNRIEELLQKVGLNPEFVDRYPHEFSGGQRQRIAIARAISIQPEFVVADEPVSALDVSIRAQVINLMQRLQREMGLTYLFISHDMSVIRHVSNRVAVMYLGKLMEFSDRADLYVNPLHPIPWRCCRRYRFPTHASSANANGSSSRATCRVRSTSPQDAASIRAVRLPRVSVARLSRHWKIRLDAATSPPATSPNG